MARRNPRLKKSGTTDEYTPEQVTEFVKCMHDPIYFARTYVKIKHPIRGRIQFDLYGYQEEVMRMYVENRYNILLSARQTGKTETTCAFLLWYAIFHDDKTILVVSNKSTNAKEIIGKIQYAYEELPDWLKPGVNDNSWNKHECAFDNKSRILATTTASDSGRGLAISLLFCDEFAFVRPHIQEEFWDSVSPTLATGGSCIIASTPNGDSNKFAVLYRGAELGNNDFKHKHIPWDAPPGRDAKFKETQIGLLGERKWKQEYECDFLSADGNLFDAVVLAQLERGIKDRTVPVFNIGEQIFWAPIEKGATYLVSVDPSVGLGEDYSVIQVFSFPKLEQVMEFRGNLTSTPLLYARLKNLLKYISSYGCSVYFSVENNGIGNGVIALYEVDENQPNALLVSEPIKAGVGMTPGVKGNKLGMTTTGRNKLATCIKMKEMVERGAFTFHSLTLIKEMQNYVRKDGSYAANLGATDDCISALLIIIRIIEQMVEFDMSAYSMMYSFENKTDWLSSEDGKIGYDPDDHFIYIKPIAL
jgi:hypothetical protein